MSTGALFHDEMSETTDVGMSGWVISERVLARWRRPVASGEALVMLHRAMRSVYHIGAPPWPSKWPEMDVH